MLERHTTNSDWKPVAHESSTENLDYSRPVNTQWLNRALPISEGSESDSEDDYSTTVPLGEKVKPKLETQAKELGIDVTDTESTSSSYYGHPVSQDSRSRRALREQVHHYPYKGRCGVRLMTILGNSVCATCAVC